MYLSKVILLVVLLLSLTIGHADQTYGPLRNGETLWTIAPKVKPSDTITRHQMIVALLKANPHAFRIPCNINSLKIKQTLTIPSLEEIESLSQQQALEEYKAQNAAWKAFRRQGVEIECEMEDVAPVSTTEAISQTEATAENQSVTSLNAQAVPAAVVNVESDNVTLPKLSSPIEKAEVNDNATEEVSPQLDAKQLASNDDKSTNYLPIIIVFGVVFFVFILAFLFRNHSDNKPIPEDLA